MAYTVVGDQRVVGLAQLWRKIAEFTMPRDFSLKCKTFETPGRTQAYPPRVARKSHFYLVDFVLSLGLSILNV